MGQNIILLADDDRDDREMFQEALEIINDELLCYTAVNGSELFGTTIRIKKIAGFDFPGHEHARDERLGVPEGVKT
jgi:hypothetical protein